MQQRVQDALGETGGGEEAENEQEAQDEEKEVLSFEC